MREKVKRKLVWDDKGVSEIIADILILSLTVVLFAIIFLFVWTLPAPDEATYADFETNVELVGGNAEIYITHTGGEDLVGKYTDLYLYKNIEDGIEPVRILSTKGVDDDNPAPIGYGLTVDSMWSTGETWTYTYKFITSSDDLDLRIIDTKSNSLILSTKLIGAGANDGPIIMERWYTPSPGQNASDITIYARIMDPDGYGDINWFNFNVSILNKTLPGIDYTFTPESDTTLLVETDPIFVDRGMGTYTLTLRTKDFLELQDTARMIVEIGSTALNAPRILERWTIPEVGVNSTDITIYCRVEDIDGPDNIDYVKANVGNLTNPNGSANIVSMTDPEQDGIWEYKTVVNVTKGDRYTLEFEVMDVTGLSDQGILNVSVKKFKPVISRTWTNPTIGKDEEWMAIYAEVYDPDGYSDLNLSSIMVNLSNLNPALGWMVMDDQPEQDGIFEYNFTIDVAYGGNKTVYFMAKDKENNMVTARINVFVATRNPPIILNRWTDPVFPENGTDLKIYAMVMDPDGYEDINFTGSVRANIWNLDRDLNYSDGWINMVDVNWDGEFIAITLVDQEEGTHLIELNATDGFNYATATMNVTILPYRPGFLNVWTSPAIGRNGTDIEIFANVIDPDGYADIAQVQVDVVELDQSLNQSVPYWVNMTDLNQNGTFNFTQLINVNETGIYSLNFIVKDWGGNTATANLKLLVTSNKPNLLQTWYTPDPVLNGTYVKIYAWAWDDDGLDDIISVRANVTLLNSSLVAANQSLWINLTDPDGNGIYENMTFVNVTDAGDYDVVLEVRDSTNNTYSATMPVKVTLIQITEGIEPSIVGIVVPNGASGGGSVFISALAFNGTSPEDKIITVTFQLLDGPVLQWPATEPNGEVEMDRLYEYVFQDPNYSTGRTAPYTKNYNDYVYVRFRAYNSTNKTPENKIAQEIVTLLIIWDKSGGKVTEGTALEQNVAWISGEQGFVITNNKSTPDPHQIFDTSDPEDEYVWIKIGSNPVTNTEKTNIFKLHSRTKDVDVEPYSSLQFKYDGQMAGYWFFVLNFSAKELYDGWMGDNGLTSEYFDIYMKIKDSTDDFFATNSWIVVHGGTPDFYAEVIAYYEPGYTPGEYAWDAGNPYFPSGLQRADAGTILDNDDDHVFNSTERLYLRIIVNTPTDTYPNVDANQVELVDFTGNRPIASAPKDGPVSIPKINPGFDNDYMIVVDLLRANKDPWVIGESAYTVFIRDFWDSNEQFDFMSTNVLIDSPTSILDVVSGMPSQSSTTRDNYVGFYYENIGIFDHDPYEIIPGGADDDVKAIWSVAFADLDNDDRKDVVAATQYGALYLYQNNGFWTRQTLDTITGEAFTNVYSGDIDNDGDDDIVAGDSGGNVYYYENDGNWGGFPDQTISSGFGAIGDTSKNQDHSDIGDHALSLVDIDNDNCLDLVIGGANGLFYCLFDSSTKQFGGATQITTKSIFCVDTGDVNQDDRNDIAYFDNDNNVVYIKYNDGTAPNYFDSTTHTVAAPGVARVSIALGDLDGSGWLEVVVGRSYLEVYTYASGAWALATNQPSGYLLADNGEITSIMVDNVDGAIQDDIMIATAGDLPSGDGGFILYFRNMGLGSDYLLMTPPVENLKQNIGTTQEICTITLGDADEGLA